MELLKADRWMGVSNRLLPSLFINRSCMQYSPFLYFIRSKVATMSTRPANALGDWSKSRHHSECITSHFSDEDCFPIPKSVS